MATFLSNVLGCRLKLVVEDDNESIFLSERLLGAIEALLATSLHEEVFPYREDYVVRVERSNRVKGTPELEIDHEGGFSILRHNGNILTAGHTEENWLLETLRLADWNTDGNPTAYIGKRAVPWHDGLIPEKGPETLR